MTSLLLVLALAADPAVAAPASGCSPLACTASRLRAFVGPTGIHQPWPVAEELPSQLGDSPSELLSGQGMVADGYTHRLHVDEARKAAYVVQEGGIAGLRTVYGPLPIGACLRPLSSSSSKSTRIRDVTPLRS